MAEEQNPDAEGMDERFSGWVGGSNDEAGETEEGKDWKTNGRQQWRSKKSSPLKLWDRLRILPYLLVAFGSIDLIMGYSGCFFLWNRQHGNSNPKPLMQLTQGSVVELDRLPGEPPSCN